ncbi:hypothetical protein H4Q26_011562 [Puccinia striiformis f. sp. tritici PST-130]|nr:hypothetical protein H4Q26_011562 [Puccinia striiformis f. sp. tritici PST-130]
MKILALFKKKWRNSEEYYQESIVRSLGQDPTPTDLEATDFTNHLLVDDALINIVGASKIGYGSSVHFDEDSTTGNGSSSTSLANITIRKPIKRTSGVTPHRRGLLRPWGGGKTETLAWAERLNPKKRDYACPGRTRPQCCRKDVYAALSHGPLIVTSPPPNVITAANEKPGVNCNMGLVYAGLLAFNILTQSRRDIRKTVSMRAGPGTSCGPASLRLSDDIYTVETGNAENDPEGLGVANHLALSNGLLVISPDLPMQLEAKSIQASCTTVIRCPAICVRLLTFQRPIYLTFAKDLQLSLQNRLGNIDSAYGSLTFEPHTLPLSGFPPYYSSDQPDVYGNRTFTSNDFTQLTIWIGDINFTTGDASASGFQFSVLGIGGVRPLGAQLNLGSNVPAPLSDLFHNSLSTLGWMMNAASADLNGRSDRYYVSVHQNEEEVEAFHYTRFGGYREFLARKYDERNPDNDVEAGHDPEDSDERRRVSKVSQIPLIKSS